MDSFGAWLSKRRKDKRWSRRELANEVGVTPTTVFYWEKNERSPSPQALDKIVEALGLDPESLPAFPHYAVASHLKVLDRARRILSNPDFPPTLKDRLARSIAEAIDAVESEKPPQPQLALIPIAGWHRDLSPRLVSLLIRERLEEAKAAGITKAVVVVTPDHEEYVRKLLGRNKALTVIPQHAAGLGNAIQLAKDAVHDDPFFVIFPDEAVGPRCLQRLAEVFATGKQASLVAVKKPAREDPGRYGFVTLGKGGRIQHFIEKPGAKVLVRKAATRVIVGRYLLTPAIFASLDNTQPNKRTRQVELTDALAELARTQPIYAELCPVSVKPLFPNRKQFDQMVRILMSRARVT